MIDIETLREAEALAQRELTAAQQLVREARVQLRDRLTEESKILETRERAFRERQQATEAMLKRDASDLRAERQELNRQISAVDDLLNPPEPTFDDDEVR